MLRLAARLRKGQADQRRERRTLRPGGDLLVLAAYVTIEGIRAIPAWLVSTGLSVCRDACVRSTHGSSPTVHASCPRLKVHDAPGADGYLGAVVEMDCRLAGQADAGVVSSAGLGACDRLDVVRTAPARLEGPGFCSPELTQLPTCQ